MTTSSSNKFDFQELAQRWSSPLVARNQEQLDRFSGGILNARSLANADSLGIGPKERIKIGRKVAYPVDALIEWLEQKQEC